MTDNKFSSVKQICDWAENSAYSLFDDFLEIRKDKVYFYFQKQKKSWVQIPMTRLQPMNKGEIK